MDAKRIFVRQPKPFQMDMDLKFESYDLLKAKIGDDAAKAVVNLVQAETLDVHKQREGVLATREDLARLEASLRVELKENKIDTIKWIVGMSIIQTATLIGGLIAIVKFIQPN